MVSTRPPRAMTISGSDSGGVTGIQADLQTFSALGVYGTSVLTAVVAQNMKETAAIAEVPEEVVIAQIDAVAEDIGAAAVKTGMLGGAGIIVNVVDRLEAWGFPHIVVHPTINSPFGVPLLSADGLKALREELIPLSTVLTADLTDAEALTNQPTQTPEQIESAAAALHEQGATTVAISGGRRNGEPAILVSESSGTTWLGAAFGDKLTPHLSNHLFSAAITAFLAHGCATLESVELAGLYVAAARPNGSVRGSGLASPNYGLTLPQRIIDRLKASD